MKIHITSGVGSGPTPMAAFDEALYSAAAINHNMIYLSSFIPPGTIIQRGKYVVPIEHWGKKVYVVMARQDAMQIGEEAWAGLGWVQDESGRGIFVEQHGTSKDAVEKAIHATLEFMIKLRGIPGFGPIQTEIAGISCQGDPVCSISIAIYEVEAWNT